MSQELSDQNLRLNKSGSIRKTQSSKRSSQAQRQIEPPVLHGTGDVENRDVTALRDATMEMVDADMNGLGDTLVRRARHVITENQRVVEACEALEAGDLPRLGKLVSASHSSLRDDFEISCKPVDDLVNIADGCEGALGSRQVGGGFGGCVLVITSADAVDDVRARITKDYSAILGSEPWTHVVSGANPAGRVQE